MLGNVTSTTDMLIYGHQRFPPNFSSIGTSRHGTHDAIIDEIIIAS